jgi:hypothetical protein
MVKGASGVSPRTHRSATARQRHVARNSGTNRGRSCTNTPRLWRLGTGPAASCGAPLKEALRGLCGQLRGGFSATSNGRIATNATSCTGSSRAGGGASKGMALGAIATEWHSEPHSPQPGLPGLVLPTAGREVSAAAGRASAKRACEDVAAETVATAS